MNGLQADRAVDVDVTIHLIEETNKRAADLQRLAFEASSALHPFSEVDYFIVTREYYSGLFYGFSTNCTVQTILETLTTRHQPKEKQDEKAGDIVGRFRKTFSPSLERTGVLRKLTDALSQSVECECLTIAISSNRSGEVTATKVFEKDFRVCNDPPSAIKSAIQAIKVIDQRIAEIANTLSTPKDGATGPSGGFCLIVKSNEKLEEPNALRRPKLQLMQIGLIVNCTDDLLKLVDDDLPIALRTAMASSKVAAYSVLYEKERYFEKAIRQAVRGSIIKWGLSEQHDDFVTQIEALDSCNFPKNTHGAPVVLQRQDSPGSEDGGNEGEKDRPLPWYEMVRYNMPSLDVLLTTTRGLQKFEVQSLARATFMHLDQHFWKFSSQVTAARSYKSVSTKAMPVASFLMLKDHVERSTTKMIKKMEQWKKNIPIQSGVGGLDLPRTEWGGAQSLCERVLGNNCHDLNIGIKIHKDLSESIFSVSPPDHTINKLITCWCDDRLDEKVDLPKFVVQKCHGDPHFENIFVDASVPEDPFIVAIDPSSADYNKDKSEDSNFIRILDDKRDRIEMLKSMGSQPIHDIAKLLLSTSGNYALIMQDGFSGKFDQDKTPSKYSLSWRAQSTTLPIGREAGGVSGARIFVRSVSATPEARSYQYYFAAEVLAQFDSQMDILLERNAISEAAVITICKNTFLIQLWASVVRHTFLIAEALLPSRADKSDQALVFALYLLDGGAKLLERGSLCLSDTDTSVSLLRLLSLRDMMDENHAW